jgi:hypothetical protein
VGGGGGGGGGGVQFLQKISETGKIKKVFFKETVNLYFSRIRLLGFLINLFSMLFWKKSRIFQAGTQPEGVGGGWGEGG